MAFYHSCFRPTAVDSLIRVSQGKQKLETVNATESADICISFISCEDSTFDNVPMIAFCMPNYSVIRWSFVILFGVAKSEFNISRCWFSF